MLERERAATLDPAGMMSSVVILSAVLSSTSAVMASLSGSFTGTVLDIRPFDDHDIVGVVLSAGLAGCH